MYTTTLTAFLLSLAGFAMLSLSMDRHQEKVLRQSLTGTLNHGLKIAGMALLLLALTACMVAQTESVAAIIWLGLLTFAALCVAALLSYWPRALLPASALALLMAATMAMAG